MVEIGFDSASEVGDNVVISTFIVGDGNEIEVVSLVVDCASEVGDIVVISAFTVGVGNEVEVVGSVVDGDSVSKVVGVTTALEVCGVVVTSVIPVVVKIGCC